MRERFFVQVNEGSILMTAEIIEYSKCVQSNGISWVAQDLTKSYEPESQMFYEFGPWTEDMANRFGSVQPMSQDTLFAKNSRFIAIKTDLKNCYRREGLTFEDSDSPLGFHIKGASSSVINVTQIHLALQDVKCKTQTHTIERVADLWANYEVPFIEKNSADLQAYRASIDKALSQAKGDSRKSRCALGVVPHIQKFPKLSTNRNLFTTNSIYSFNGSTFSQCYFIYNLFHRTCKRWESGRI